MTADWIDSWRAQGLDALAARFAELGADEPASWASSELDEDIAQTARYLFLRALWRRMEDALDDAMSDPAVARIAAAGIDADEIGGVLRRALYSLSFNVAYLIDEPDGGWHPTPPNADVGAEDPRWRLMEVAPDGTLTGRDVVGLHESVLETDPTRREAADWL